MTMQQVVIMIVVALFLVVALFVMFKSGEKFATPQGLTPGVGFLLMWRKR